MPYVPATYIQPCTDPWMTEGDLRVAKIEKRVREMFSPDPDIDFVYLFGSVAKGRAWAANDVDVAVHFRRPSTPSGRFDRGLELEAQAERALCCPV